MSSSLSLKAYPVSFICSELAAKRAVPTADLSKYRDGMFVRVGPSACAPAAGVCFITIEGRKGRETAEPLGRYSKDHRTDQ